MDEEPQEVLESRLKHAGIESSTFPQTEEEADAVDELLSNELAALSLVEQDKVMFDVHGLAPEIEETEELIEKSLEDMDKELEQIKKKPAFDMAMKMNPGHVQSRELRIRFLRCEFFKCKNAAKRLVLHFEKKKMMFGDGDVLGRDVRLSDMSAEDLEHMKYGAIQVLPTRDASGRSVLAWVPGNFKGKKFNVRTSQRVMYYIIDTTSREEETQKKGFVVVFWFVGRKGLPTTFGLFQKLHSIRLAMPHKMLGLHYCFDDKALRPFMSGFHYLLDNHARKRFRAHYGDEQKIAFLLQTYGIPWDDQTSPFKQTNGEFNLKWHQEWMQLRQTAERSPDGKQPIVIPHRFDVLFGRGKMSREHTGNLRAAHLVNMWQKKYDEASGRYEKTTISEKLVAIVNESGGRFLKWEESGWMEVEHSVAREKVSHWFRHNRQKNSESTKESLEGTQKPKRRLDHV